jgi:site-specific DNA-adenine methylase
MKIPSFRHMGGKARLRSWLISHFPVAMETYVEPFAGKGNVFFSACSTVNALRFVLNDIDTNFLVSLLAADLNLLPESVSKEEFSLWKTRTDHVARLIEPRITFAGKGYKYGYSGSSGTHVGYSGESYRLMCQKARYLLNQNHVEITTGSWEQALILGSSEDFVYLDPPYLGTQASYGNIDHQKLVTVLNDAKFRWAISGYGNTLYDTNLNFTGRFEKKRNSEIKSSNTGSFEEVTEVLWTNW